MEFQEAIKKRQSIRNFENRKVEFSDMEKLIKAAQLAPSACNMQLTEYVVLDNEVLIKELEERVSKKFSWAPNFIVVIYDPRFTSGRSADLQSAGMAMENILLTAIDLGLGACPMAGFESDKKIKDILNIPKIYKVALLIAVGYPKEELKEKQRLSIERILHQNKYNGKPLKDSINIKDWTVEDIIDYRQRIAPVYLYKNHYRLNSFHPDVNKKAVEFFKENFPNLQGKRVLDLFSYDTDFLRELIRLNSGAYLISANYLRYVNDFVERELNIKAVQVENENKINLPDKSVDVITCINKLEFTPDVHKTFNEMKRILKPNGKIFCMNFAKSSVFNILEKQGSVYKNNSFYKIGAYGVAPIRVSAMFHNEYNFNIEKDIDFRMGRYNFSLYIFQKQ